ncbi:hypothetical protein EDD37DRAFT_480971 [Exophiala viscosa]|uniref:uncharacterized protein n=1 Tax=Exophiala viscosa TaxID=2486360 RepID=UPI00218FE0E6|nr:hypothetical protein EDD37DRAFT_480971 [Exophiala viscosa]
MRMAIIIHPLSILISPRWQFLHRGFLCLPQVLDHSKQMYLIPVRLRKMGRKEHGNAANRKKREHQPRVFTVGARTSFLVIIPRLGSRVRRARKGSVSFCTCLPTKSAIRSHNQVDTFSFRFSCATLLNLRDRPPAQSLSSANRRLTLARLPTAPHKDQTWGIVHQPLFLKRLRQPAPTLFLHYSSDWHHCDLTSSISHFSSNSATFQARPCLPTLSQQGHQHLHLWTESGRLYYPQTTHRLSTLVYEHEGPSTPTQAQPSHPFRSRIDS